MTPSFDEDAAVTAFWNASHSGRHFPADWHGRLSFEEGYRIQLGVVARHVSAGAVQAGWKVAQTSEAARSSFGFTEPIFGCVMSEGVRRSGHLYGRADLISPRCEPEICVRLKSDLFGQIDAAKVRQALDMIYPAFEIIEVRGDIPAQKALAIADNSATKDVVLGQPVPIEDGLDLAALTCRFRLNDDEALLGAGTDVLGDPLNAIVWLAGKLAEFGRGLRSGELIMTGSLTRPLPLAPGDRAQAEFPQLGRIEVSIAA